MLGSPLTGAFPFQMAVLQVLGAHPPSRNSSSHSNVAPGRHQRILRPQDGLSGDVGRAAGSHELRRHGYVTSRHFGGWTSSPKGAAFGFMGEMTKRCLGEFSIFILAEEIRSIIFPKMAGGKKKTPPRWLHDDLSFAGELHHCTKCQNVPRGCVEQSQTNQELCEENRGVSEWLLGTPWCYSFDLCGFSSAPKDPPPLCLYHFIGWKRAC